VAEADLVITVITGEDPLDDQSLYAEAPTGVVRAAGVLGVGSSAAALPTAAGGRRPGSPMSALQELQPDPAQCMRRAGTLVRRAAADLTHRWLPASARGVL
jgi:hypothetical protein